MGGYFGEDCVLQFNEKVLDGVRSIGFELFFLFLNWDELWFFKLLFLQIEGHDPTLIPINFRPPNQYNPKKIKGSLKAWSSKCLSDVWLKPSLGTIRKLLIIIFMYNFQRYLGVKYSLVERKRTPTMEEGYILIYIIYNVVLIVFVLQLMFFYIYMGLKLRKVGIYWKIHMW